MFALKLLAILSLIHGYSSTSLTQQLQQILLTRLTNATLQSDLSVHEDFGLDIIQFLRKYEYPLETHWVTTEDGYILRLHRIPRGKKTIATDRKVRPPVLLMHGLSSCSMDWVNTGPKSALGLKLADAGYDVWLGNNRGNTWSRYHQTLDPDVDLEKFWDFSFEECGLYDLPAMIDYILKATGEEQIMYVGHSQGTSQYFAMAAMKPEYNNKIALMTALAPVAYMKYTSSPLIKVAVQYLDILKFLANNVLKLHEIMPHSWLIQEIGKLLCSDGSHFKNLCATILFNIVGFDPPQLNTNFIPVIVSNTPAGFSLKMLIHYADNIKSGEFKRYNYGSGNSRRYNSTVAPAFNISAITSPVVLYYAQNDLLSSVTDVERLAAELPNVVRHVHINYTFFNHLDYLFANDINTLLNDDLIEYIEEFIENRSTTKPSVTTQKPNNGSTFSLSILVLICSSIMRYVFW